MENITIYPSDSRGFADHGWLKARHSFSFASYHNPERVHFGMLRVLNDDIVEAGRGFGMHPHDNMEIITIPIKGALEHKDNMGNHAVIRAGDVQVMSAGTGVLHSEYNPNMDQSVELLQIWVFPNKKNVTPRYDQVTLDLEKIKDQLVQIVGPQEDKDGLWIHQDAWFHLGYFGSEKEINYALHKPDNGIYVFIISGQFDFENNIVKKGDAIGIKNQNSFDIKSLGSDSKLLIIEVPMN